MADIKIKVIERLKDLGKDTLLYSVGSATSQLLSLILIPYYTDTLTPLEYGNLATFGLLTTSITPITNLGLDSALFRHYIMSESKVEKSTYFFSSLILRIVVSLFFSILFCFSYKQVSEFMFESSISERSYYYSIINFFIFSISQFGIISMRASRKVTTFVIGQTISLISGVFFSIIFVLGYKWGVEGAVLANLIAQSISALFTFINIKEMLNINYLSIKKLSELLKYGFPYISHRIQGVFIQNYVTFSINKWHGLTLLGIYSIGIRFSKPIDLVVNSIQKAWSPYKFHVHKSDPEPHIVFSILIPNYWALLIFIWGICSILGSLVINFFINKQFYGVDHILPFIMLVPISLAFCWTVGTGYELSPSQKRIPQSSLVSAISLVAFNTIIQDTLGISGLALSQSIAYITGGVFLYFYARKIINIRYKFLQIFSALLFQSLILFFFFNSKIDKMTISIICIILSTILFISIFFLINRKIGFIQVKNKIISILWK